MLIYLRNQIWNLFFLIFFAPSILSDNFQYNSYNNHGVLGLINMPTARIYNEGSIGITVYDGTPDQKITITASPYDWLEASFFYTSIQDKPYPGFPDEDYKDKGFNFKLKLKSEGIFPAIAIGINDIAGTGFYSSEYIVSSYGIKNLDLHFGIGWGALSGGENRIKNPLIYLDERFKRRVVEVNQPGDYAFAGTGSFSPGSYFSGEKISPFYGISYSISNKILLKVEHDSTFTPGKFNYNIPSSRTSVGLEYSFNKNFTLGISSERDDYFSVKFIYKQNAASPRNQPKYKKIEKSQNDSKYDYFIKSLESNGIGVNKLYEKAESIGVEFTQFSIPNLDLIEDIIYRSKMDAGIDKDIKKDYRIADLQVYSNFNDEYEQTSKLIYKRESARSFNTDTKFNIRPYLAAREGFFKFAFLIENNSEYIIKDNFFFSSNLKYSVKDNFGDLTIPPKDTYPAQVRSDVKDYLRNFENRIIIGRAQFDYHINPKKNHHVMLSGGILEEMFNGLGIEYLYFDTMKSYALGFELFHVKKRDYKLRFGSLDYQTNTGFLNFYYRNNFIIPFDAKVSYGKYLAGDLGATFELSRRYKNGAELGVFASFTNVTAEQFGEGTFDKGIFFNIPIYKNFVNYSWRPLTKDPGARLNRKYTLNDLLIKFRPYSD